MRVNRQLIDTLLYSLLIGSSLSVEATNADEPPSMDFLEYLGTEENLVDNQWTGPVDLDIEQYLVANSPDAKASENSEDNKHE